MKLQKEVSKLMKAQREFYIGETTGFQTKESKTELILQEFSKRLKDTRIENPDILEKTYNQ